MLCSRSASLTSSTRMSSDIASRNLRRFSAARSVSDLRLDLRQLGDAVDHPRDIVAEQLLDLLGGGDGVLDRVVEDRGRDRLVVEVEVGQDARDFDRVAEIGVARGALLAAVRLERKDVGAVEQRFVSVGIVAQNPIDQFVLAQHLLSKMPEPRCFATKIAKILAATRRSRPARGGLVRLGVALRQAVGVERLTAGGERRQLADALRRRAGTGSGRARAPSTR